MTRYITICGRKQTGKDTTANDIARLYNAYHGANKAQVVHFADVLKEACHLVFGIDRKLLFGSDQDKNTLTHIKWPDMIGDINGQKVWSASNHESPYMTIRDVLQFVGTDLFRNQIRAPVWTESIFRKPYIADLIIVADCRFRDEAQYSLQQGILIKIERPNNPSPAGTHASEIEVDLIPKEHFRYTLINDGPLESITAFSRHVLMNEGLI